MCSLKKYISTWHNLSLQKVLSSLALTLLISQQGFAHHGVASLGASGLEGPGAPVESSSSATLPEGDFLAYLKVDHAKSQAGSIPAPKSDYNQYRMLGLGYGVTPWFSAYLFQPYHIKEDTSGGLSSEGFADLSVMGVIGFKYDRGLQLVSASESLDDMMDWHFTLYGGVSGPTGNPNHRLADGSIDPSKSLGFGHPSMSYGATASKQLSKNATVVVDAGQIHFQSYRYADNTRLTFGTETRFNLALPYRLFHDANSKLRIDASPELNYLVLDRDRENGIGAEATGGRILYGVLGSRIYFDNMSVGLALKKPIWTQLNESNLQQGSEGKEDYRFIATLSALF